MLIGSRRSLVWHRPVSSGGVYTGPGNVVSGALAYYGVRGWNAAYATGSNNALHDATVGNLPIATSGFINTSGATTGDQIDTVNDQSGNSNNGTQSTGGSRPTLTLTGGPFTHTTAYFNFSSQFWTIGPNGGSLYSALNGTPSFTFVAWVNPSSLGFNGIIGCTLAGAPEWRIELTTGQMDLLNQNNNLLGSSTTGIAANTWSHVAVSYNAVSGAGAFYINGAAAGTFTMTTTFTIGGDITLGAAHAETWAGGIAEFIIYGSVLSGGQISNLFNNPSS